MKSVLISIQPKYVEKIANGEKTIEVRKTRPKLETPFKCFIYCTNDKNIFLDSDINKKFWTEKNYGGKHYYNGKVIGEFICDRIDDLKYVPTKYYGKPAGTYEEIICCASCLTFEEVKDYAKGGNIYGWHISDLKIYDKPKELNEFTPVCEYKGERCDNCKFYVEQFGGCCRTLSRPPQSWCYVEEL